MSNSPAQRVEDSTVPSLPSEAMVPLSDDVEAPTASLEALAQALGESGRSGANWFFWIAALSLVNSAILHGGGDRHFVIGLAVTTVSDVVFTEIAAQNADMSGVVRGVAIGFSIFVAAVVAGFGWLSRARFQVVFALGMALYLLDGLLYVLFGDWLSVGFHAFALFSMWGGFSAFRKLSQVEEALQGLPA